MKHTTSFLLSLCLWAMTAISVSAAERTVSITLDDLPYVSAQDASLAAASRANEALRQALRDYHAPADLFLVGEQVERDGETAERQALMRQWEKDGHHLHNHSYSHPAFSQTDLAAYLANVSRVKRWLKACAAVTGLHRRTPTSTVRPTTTWVALRKNTRR